MPPIARGRAKLQRFNGVVVGAEVPCYLREDGPGIGRDRPKSSKMRDSSHRMRAPTAQVYYVGGGAVTPRAMIDEMALILARYGVRVSFRPFHSVGTVAGGMVRLGMQSLVVIDGAAPMVEQLVALAEALCSLNVQVGVVATRDRAIGSQSTRATSLATPSFARVRLKHQAYVATAAFKD